MNGKLCEFGEFGESDRLQSSLLIQGLSGRSIRWCSSTASVRIRRSQGKSRMKSVRIADVAASDAGSETTTVIASSLLSILSSMNPEPLKRPRIRNPPRLPANRVTSGHMARVSFKVTPSFARSCRKLENKERKLENKERKMENKERKMEKKKEKGKKREEKGRKGWIGEKRVKKEKKKKNYVAIWNYSNFLFFIN